MKNGLRKICCSPNQAFPGPHRPFIARQAIQRWWISIILKKYFLSVATTRLLLNIYRCWLPINRKLGPKHKIEIVHTQVRLLSYTSCALFLFFDRDKAYDVRHLIGTCIYKIEYIWKLQISRKMRFWENENKPLMTPNNQNPF